MKRSLVVFGTVLVELATMLGIVFLLDLLTGFQSTLTELIINFVGGSIIFTMLMVADLRYQLKNDGVLK